MVSMFMITIPVIVLVIKMAMIAIAAVMFQIIIKCSLRWWARSV